MNSIINYIFNMLPYMIIIFFVIIIIIYFKKKNKKLINYRNHVYLLIFIMFLAGLLSQAIIPKISIDFRINNINVIPFKIFVDTYNEILAGNIDYFIINFFGNIIMFIPIGFFLLLLWGISYKRTLLVGFCISLFIEISQLFLNRNTDIDDLILNTFGVAIGIYIYKVLLKKYGTKLILFKNQNHK